MDYDSYITSDAWRRRRARYFETHARQCSICRDAHDIQLHHLTYERMGTELDTDLRPLCQSCHSAVHQYRDLSGKDLDVATIEFIELARKNRAHPPAPRRPHRAPVVDWNVVQDMRDERRRRSASWANDARRRIPGRSP